MKARFSPCAFVIIKAAGLSHDEGSAEELRAVDQNNEIKEEGENASL